MISRLSGTPFRLSAGGTGCPAKGRNIFRVGIWSDIPNSEYRSNPYGAQLVFTTHHPEILDVLHRKDNVYLLVRSEDGRTEVVKYSDRIRRIENKKSEVVLSDLIRGTMPHHPDVRAMRDHVRRYVAGQA